jgi:hypothetical protein
MSFAPYKIFIYENPNSNATYLLANKQVAPIFILQKPNFGADLSTNIFMHYPR